MTDDDQRYFFIHLMKTAGGTLAWDLRSNFSVEQVYPDQRKDGPDPDKFTANTNIDYLLSIPASRKAELRVYTGHFPYCAAQMLDVAVHTITVLREPVERTISHLKHRKERVPRFADATLEEIYDDDHFFHSTIHDYQAKMFAFTTQDPVQSYMDRLEVDDERLEQAKEHLRRVDDIGLTEDFEAFRAELGARHGWTMGSAPDVHVSEAGLEASDALRERITADNQADIAFYEFARSLVAERRAG